MVDLEIDESKRWDPIERQKYLDSLPEMTLFDDHIIEGDVMVDAIQALIEDGETAESLAFHWKSKGNEMMLRAKKNKMYFEHAIKYYNDALAYALKALALPEEGRDAAFDVHQLTSQLYSNRAAVQLAQKNYGSCRSDAAKALRYDRKNVKAYFRGAKASKMLHKPVDTLRYCREGLLVDPENKQLLQLQQEGLELEESERIKAEQKAFEQKKRRAMTDKYRQLCLLRSVRVGPAVVQDERVRMFEGKAVIDAETGNVNWPVLFLYQEYGTSDFVHAFDETNQFIEHLANMFPENGPYCEWDEKHTYVASNLVLFAAANVVVPFETPEEWHVALSGEIESDEIEHERLRREALQDAKTQQWLQIDPFCTLQQVLSHPKHVIPGIPMFHLFVRDSKALQDFLDKITPSQILRIQTKH